MLRKTFVFAVTTAIAALGLAACGGSKTDDTGSGGSSGGGKDKEDPGAKWPSAPTGGNPGGGATPTVVGLNKLFVGETDRQGNTDPNAWRDYGYNIDGIISTKTGTNHCLPAVKGTAKSKIQTDGTDGIDNSFGSNLIPIITNLASNPTESITQTLQDGSFTIILKLDNIDTNPDQTAINASLYGGANFESLVKADCAADPPPVPLPANCSPPLFDGSDMWPVLPELLTDPTNIDTPKVTFPTSYVSAGTWVSGDGAGTLNLTISIQGFDLTLGIARAVITMKVQGDTATDGIIAGVIPTDQLIGELQKVAGGFDPGLCDGPTFDSIAQQIKAASDIMADGSNGDSTKTCDGISVGLGFEAKLMNLGGIAPAATAPPDPCATPN